MRRLARRLLLLSCLGGIGFGLSGCLSPTLPMPPPAKPDIEQIGEGQYRLTGRIPGAGFVTALNKRTNDTFGKLSTDRLYDFNVVAQPDDPMQLWYEVNGENSDILEFEIPSVPPAPVPDSGAPASDAAN